MSKTVLIVDDSDLIRNILAYKLKKAGYNTLSGIDGADALTLFDGRDIDLVITDLNMPNMDGIALIKEIKLHDDYRYTPIMLFISDFKDDKSQFIRISGASILFDKQAINAQLLSTVKNMIGYGSV